MSWIKPNSNLEAKRKTQKPIGHLDAVAYQQPLIWLGPESWDLPHSSKQRDRFQYTQTMLVDQKMQKIIKL